MWNVCVAHQLGGAIGNSCMGAATNGHVECLRIAHQLGGVMWGTCEYAVKGGHVECLRVAHGGRRNWNFM